MGERMCCRSTTFLQVLLMLLKLLLLLIQLPLLPAVADAADAGACFIFNQRCLCNGFTRGWAVTGSTCEAPSTSWQSWRSTKHLYVRVSLSCVVMCSWLCLQKKQLNFVFIIQLPLNCLSSKLDIFIYNKSVVRSSTALPNPQFELEYIYWLILFSCDI